MQLSSPDMRTYNGPKLFTTRDPRGSFLIGDQSPSFWLQQSFLRVPGVGCTVTLGGAALALAVLVAVGWLLRRMCPLAVFVGGSALLAALAALYGRAHGFGVVRREQRRGAVALTLGAASVATALLLLLARGELAWVWTLPVLFALELTVAVGALGLATMH
jgi:hypothetical protein